MGLGIPPLKIKIVLESNPLKPTMLVGRLGVVMLMMLTVTYVSVIILACRIVIIQL